MFDVCTNTRDTLGRLLLLTSGTNPVTLYGTPEELAASYPGAGCGGPRPAAYQLEKRPKLFLTALREDAGRARALLRALSDTAARCPDRIEPGLLHGSNAFALFLVGDGANATGMEEAVLETRLRRHPNVAIFLETRAGKEERGGGGESRGGKVLVEQLNVFEAAFELTKVWRSTSGPLRKMKDALVDLEMKVEILDWGRGSGEEKSVCLHIQYSLWSCAGL